MVSKEIKKIFATKDRTSYFENEKNTLSKFLAQHDLLQKYFNELIPRLLFKFDKKFYLSNWRT